MPGRDGLDGSGVRQPEDGECGVGGDHRDDAEGGVHKGGGDEAVVVGGAALGQDPAEVTVLSWVEEAVEMLGPCLAAAGGSRAAWWDLVDPADLVEEVDPAYLVDPADTTRLADLARVGGHGGAGGHGEVGGLGGVSAEIIL